MALKTICLICPEYPPGPHGGVGTLMQVLARGLVKIGYEVRVIGVFTKRYHFAPDYEEDNGVKVWRIKQGEGKFSWIPAWYKQYRIIKKWQRNREIDIIEAPDSRGWFAFWPKLKIPLVLRANGSVGYFAYVLNYTPNKLAFLFEKKSYQRVDGWISASAFTAKITKQVYHLEKDAEVIYNGIDDVPDFVTKEREKNKIAFSGVLMEKKGVISLIKALKSMHDKGMDFTMELYGKDYIDARGSMQEYLTSLMDEKLKIKILFKGHVTKEELYNAYSTATVAIFPSYAEAFAMAPLESMICACPTIFTKLGSGPELIEDGKDGLLVNPDNIEEIENALVKIINDKTFAKAIGEEGRRTVRNRFLKETYTKKTVDFYQKLIEKKQV
jgi:glycosyltransferase involved in cell wall biosynthesis